jgi:5-oxoprolinase (ATP-hydrolysing)
MAYIREMFEKSHEQLFTYRLPNNVELMNIRIVAQEIQPDFAIQKLEKASSTEPPESAVQSTTTLVYENKIYENSFIWDRSKLLFGHIVKGPCVISEMDSNTVILPGFSAEVDHVGNILIHEPKEDTGVAVESTNGKLDTICVDIIENALKNARNEMDTLITRASMSPAIREQQDEFNVIAEPGGKMVVGQFGSFIGQFLEAWEGTIEEGDSE